MCSPPSDLKDATDVCKDLGLDHLLKKMPGGMFQFVGEMGWQLSHGEKSRLYLARTILQGSDVVILDETFGALDPASLRQCLEATMKRCKTVVVVTHGRGVVCAERNEAAATRSRGDRLADAYVASSQARTLGRA